MEEQTTMTTAPAAQESNGSKKTTSPVVPVATDRVVWPGVAMRRFADDMDRLFDAWGTGRGWLAPVFRREPLGKRFEELFQGAFSPDVEVMEKDGRLIVRADLPGIAKEDIHVNVLDGALQIKGERHRQEEERREGFYRSERSYGRFERTIPLPKDIAGDDAAATFRDGVLEITMSLPNRPSTSKSVTIG